MMLFFTSRRACACMKCESEAAYFELDWKSLAHSVTPKHACSRMVWHVPNHDAESHMGV